jgi:hypothetical protein
MRILIAALALTVSSGALRAEEHSFWWYTKAKVACLPDVMRLCSSAMPDEDKVRDCMKTKQKLVSASCAEFYPGGKNAE